jgi:hypothetical protein
MLPLQAVLAAFMRSLGRLVNTAFGWATILLFGRVPQNRQIYLSVITFGSVIWLVVVIGTAFPNAGTWLLAFVTLPPWIDRAWVRLAMFAGVVVLPLAVGVASLLMLEPEKRPKAAGARLRLILKGLPYTMGLALTLSMLIVFAPILKARNILRRWTDRHIPVIVESRNYERVVDDVQAALLAGGVATERRSVSWLLRAPTAVLKSFAKDQTTVLEPHRLVKLVSPGLEVLLHPSDLVISGQGGDVAHAQAVISEHLTFTDAYLTWQRRSNALEDRLRNIWRARRRDALSSEDAWRELRRVERDLKALKLPYEEWEVVFRELSIVRLALLQECAAGEAAAWQPTIIPGKAARWLLCLGTAVAFLRDLGTERHGADAGGTRKTASPRRPATPRPAAVARAARTD